MFSGSIRFGGQKINQTGVQYNLHPEKKIDRFIQLDKCAQVKNTLKDIGFNFSNQCCLHKTKATKKFLDKNCSFCFDGVGTYKQNWSTGIFIF